jgi:hypothetical protein
LSAFRSFEYRHPAARAIAVVVTTASRSGRRYLISPDLEADERIGPEGRAYGDVDRIAACGCSKFEIQAFRVENSLFLEKFR